MVIAMPIIVLEMVPLIFQGVERLIFDAPPCSPTPHELIDRTFIDAQVGAPTAVLDGVLVPLPALQEVDPQVGMGGIERHITAKAKPVAQTRLGGIPIVVSDASGLLGRRHLGEQGSMVAFFNAQNS